MEHYFDICEQSLRCKVCGREWPHGTNELRLIAHGELHEQLEREAERRYQEAGKAA
jgi:hypothetical protein